METSSSFAICLLLLSFHNCDIGNLFIRNKDSFVFINGNLTLKNLVKQESFQHYYVFTLLNNVFVEGVNIYINLASEVRVKFNKTN
jgi:hypothetical protein